MKNLFSLLAIAICAVVLMVSCATSSTPTGVAEQYITAMQDEDYEKVTSLFYFDPASKKASEIKEGFTSMLTEKVKPQMEKMGGIESYEISNEQISEDGETATVQIDIVYGSGETKKDETKLVCVDGTWYLDLGK